jgi:hypothetical protein
VTHSPDLEARVAALEAIVAQFATPEPDIMAQVRTEALHGTSILTVRLTHEPTGVTVAALDRAEGVLKLRKALAGRARREYDLQEAERRRQRNASARP